MKNNVVFLWMQAKATSKYSEVWIALVSVLETVFFFPVDPFLIFFTLENRHKYLRYAVVATIMSAVGGSFAYFVGACLWHIVGAWVVGHLISSAYFDSLIWYYHTYQLAVVFVGALLPLPFKAITLSAGFCKISYLPFVSMLLCARWIRFFLVTWTTQRWGKAILAFIDRYSAPVVSLVCVKLAIVVCIAYFCK